MKRRTHLAPKAITALLTITLLAASTRSALAGPPFPDKNLEAAIRAVLKHEPKVELLTKSCWIFISSKRPAKRSRSDRP